MRPARRGTLTTLVLFAAVSPACEWLGISTPPVEDGTRLTYGVTEQTDQATREYGIQLRFESLNDDHFKLAVLTEWGSRTVKVGEELLRLEDETLDDPLEFPLASGEAFEPGLLFLPADKRRPGMMCLAGQVVGIERFEGWKAWKVLAPEGELFYETETGVLVGFDVEVTRSEVRGILRALR